LEHLKGLTKLQQFPAGRKSLWFRGERATSKSSVS